MTTPFLHRYPLVREPTRVLYQPEFTQCCGTENSPDQHRRHRTATVVYSHLHIPRSTWHDGVRIEEVSSGYRREWRRRGAAPPRGVPADPTGIGARTVIDEILPPVVVATEAFADPAGVQLFPDEDAMMARAVAKRRNEFATTRHCARAALRRLGVAPVPIVPGAGGAPQWPSGVVGSMTHCVGYRAAAIAYQRDVVTIGIDAEPHERLPAGILGLVTVPSERLMLARLAVAAPEVFWDRLLFSAKESIYKGWFPLTRRWLDFDDVEVVIDPRAGRFAAQLLVPGPIIGGRPYQEFDGRYVVRDGLMVTAITVIA